MPSSRRNNAVAKLSEHSEETRPSFHGPVARSAPALEGGHLLDTPNGAISTFVLGSTIISSFLLYHGGGNAVREAIFNERDGA